MGFLLRFASSSAGLPHGHQSTGLCLCCSRYGLVSRASRFSWVVDDVIFYCTHWLRTAGSLRPRRNGGSLKKVRTAKLSTRSATVTLSRPGSDEARPNWFPLGRNCAQWLVRHNTASELTC